LQSQIDDEYENEKSTALDDDEDILAVGLGTGFLVVVVSSSSFSELIFDEVVGLSFDEIRGGDGEKDGHTTFVVDDNDDDDSEVEC